MSRRRSHASRASRPSRSSQEEELHGLGLEVEVFEYVRREFNTPGQGHPLPVPLNSPRRPSLAPGSDVAGEPSTTSGRTNQEPDANAVEEAAGEENPGLYQICLQQLRLLQEWLWLLFSHDIILGR